MSYSSATTNAQNAANQSADQSIRLLAQALADLSRAVQMDMTQIKQQLDQLQRQQR